MEVKATHMMISVLVPLVDMHECHGIPPGLVVVQRIRLHEGQGLQIPIHRLVKHRVIDHNTVMAQLVDFARPVVEPLELAFSRLILPGIENHRLGCLLLPLLLLSELQSMDQSDIVPLRILDVDIMSTTRGRRFRDLRSS